jgi:hypothetical protein
MEIMDAIMFLREWNDKEAFEATGMRPHEFQKKIVMEDIVQSEEHFLGYKEALYDLSQYFFFLRGPLREKELEIKKKIEELGKNTVDHYGYDGYMDKPKG